ncbi:biotin--[acetyl-CoA-carboxylase] ligase [Agromyces cerinus]|uniref:BirA family transcriptional regulator, biotin operon repressor / biotin-[acetyl-CoA-carboxylase] ligase n=1 Tax=Agromyces cerinus subsp. cerinus TaxID=232089 RepID=A0A1N6DHW9_9MICO|nr:biotin--[acetyl-CoA-carboxylase] ligase [Agromyces cerinus]SIN70274.1 BirA family transcriptional regulator, biotin operon repressor / biotin-[acetyl-CoA-carboxylase] ligase [Agromyces cerinus subsp. cerinus]
MDWERSRAAVPRFEFRDEVGSTNDELRAAASGPDAAGWGHGAVLVTDNQTHGRGRLGRVWLAPTGKTLAISVLLRPELDGGAPLPPDAYGWIPLIAGAAMTEAVRRAVELHVPAGTGAGQPPSSPEQDAPTASARPSRRRLRAEEAEEPDGSGGVDVELKWPNDVLVSGYKICGILSELLPDSGAVIVGAGLNLTLDEHDLPTLTSTSLLLVTGVQPDADAVLADYLATFLRMFGAFVDSGADAAASGVAARVAELCGTIGSDVRVELPGDRELLGHAERLDADGRLVVIDRENGEPWSVAAGDVTHLRY